MDKTPSFCKKPSHLDSFLHRLAHADNTTAAYTETDFPGGMDGFHLLLDRMRGTKLTEIGRGGLYIAVIILHSAIVKRLELGAG